MIKERKNNMKIALAQIKVRAGRPDINFQTAGGFNRLSRTGREREFFGSGLGQPRPAG